ncbi:hypothetical protein F0562_007484 [Nyssa sinensis]|uniref:Uncharacterized protein n=1 Tax=Nyssa sinensis TaxID=561372 RepID=A0A5J5A5Z9_9ASTE|nr:hypothetical protein F0562_007484 [Nyssa sinensis]
MASAEAANIVRPAARFAPSLWGDSFTSFSSDYQVPEMLAKEIEVLKEEVRSMLMEAESKAAEKINLIDTIERLGVSYHFEKEIEEQLKQIFNSQDAEDYDLCTMALHFRLFRQHGYNISCSVFNKFKDSNDKFVDTLTSDVRGMLSFYQATHLRVYGEDVLEEALAFTTTHLESMVTHVCPTLAKQVTHALEQPLHKGMSILEARHYISVYQEEQSKNETLLRLAKLDLNLLQLLHQQEISQISRWWKDLDFTSKLPFARDRVVECYFWALGVYYEPNYSQARIILAKTIAMISVIDDTYDAYGTLEELEIFTGAVQRWDSSIIDHLPDYMKIIYKALLNLYEDFDMEMTKQGRPYVIYHAKGMKELVRSYNTEAKWFIEGYIPPFDDYINIALKTSTYHILTISAFMGMGEDATNEAFNWLQNKPKIIVAIEKICRLIDDVATYEVETGRGQVATGIECYMKQHGVSKQEAMDELYKMAENAWKDLNEECLALTSISNHLLTRVVNLACVIEVVYKHFEDGYTIPEKMLKNYIISLLVDPIPL